LLKDEPGYNYFSTISLQTGIKNKINEPKGGKIAIPIQTMS